MHYMTHQNINMDLQKVSISLIIWTAFFEIADKGNWLCAIEQLKQEAYTDCVDLLDKPVGGIK